MEGVEMGRVFNSHKRKDNVLVPKREEEIPLGRPRRRWENNININLKQLEWENVKLIHLALDRDQWRALVNTEMKLPTP
jgi:hypothetical protein